MRAEEESLTASAGELLSASQGHDILEDSSPFLTSLLALSPFPIVVINPDTSVRYVNPATTKLTGFSYAELVGARAPYPYWPEKQRGALLEELLKVLGTRGDNIEYRFQKKDGSYFWTEIADRPLIIDGVFKYLISAWVDVTKRKRLEENLKRSNKQLRGLSVHLETVREKERAEIARELHDELGQSLTAIQMDLHWLQRNLEVDKEALRTKLEFVATQANLTMQTVRRLYTELRPKVLDDLGLASAVEWLVEEFQASSGISCELTIGRISPQLSAGIATCIFRVVQQSLNNIYLHSRANRVTISMGEASDQLRLKITDDGQGIRKEQINNPQAFGLIGMRERVHYWQGDFAISGSQNRGTTTEVSIPLQQGARR